MAGMGWDGSGTLWDWDWRGTSGNSALKGFFGIGRGEHCHVKCDPALTTGKSEVSSVRYSQELLLGCALRESAWVLKRS